MCYIGLAFNRQSDSLEKFAVDVGYKLFKTVTCRMIKMRMLHKKKTYNIYNMAAKKQTGHITSVK